jgi:hypothetical protein
MDVTTKAQLEAHRLAATAFFLRARDRCPIMAEPQLQLALGADLFATSDGRDKYWARVMELVRNDSLLWFLLGVEHLREGRIDETCQNWRRSLELSDRWLAEIVSRSRGRMEASEILRRVLPDDPEQRRVGEARQSYRAAVSKEPSRLDWRLEFAELLYQEGKLEDAKNELHFIIGQNREHTEGKKLLLKILAQERAPK